MAHFEITKAMLIAGKPHFERDGRFVPTDNVYDECSIRLRIQSAHMEKYMMCTPEFSRYNTAEPFDGEVYDISRVDIQFIYKTDKKAPEPVRPVEELVDSADYPRQVSHEK